MATEGDDYICANAVWYGYIKPRIIVLVGDGAYHMALNNCHCYDLVYDYLSKTLPDCHNCGELSLNDIFE
jgi:hypothetical protein